MQYFERLSQSFFRRMFIVKVSAENSGFVRVSIRIVVYLKFRLVCFVRRKPPVPNEFPNFITGAY